MNPFDALIREAEEKQDQRIKALMDDGAPFDYSIRQADFESSFLLNALRHLSMEWMAMQPPPPVVIAIEDLPENLRPKKP